MGRPAKVTRLLLNLLQHPVWLVGGCWIALVVAGVIAWRSLADYKLSKEPLLTATPSTVTIQPPAIPMQAAPLVRPTSNNPPSNQDSEDSVPPWSLVVVAVGGAIGSMMISQRLHQPQTVRRLIKRSPSSPNSESIPS